MELPIQLVIKVQQFEDKRIEAKASWNIKELKGKLSEIYPTSTEEQKLIYSGKLLNDTVVLKDVLREYEGQEAHTVHLVFTPKSSSQTIRQPLKIASSTSQSTTQNISMNPNELRQRHTPVVSGLNTNASQVQQQSNAMNIPSNYASAFYGGSGDSNSIIAQQYAMQTWMQQAYQQYMNQYISLIQSPEAFYQMNQQSQQSQNFAFIQPQMPFVPPVSTAVTNDESTPHAPNTEAQAAAVQAIPQAPQVAEPQERRFPNIIQDEQENRDWLDIIYSVSRLMILLCLVYFYSSPIRCLVVVLIGISIYLYHVYKENQNRANNNNSTRVNLNTNRQEAVPQQAQPQVDELVTGEQREGVDGENEQQQQANEAEPLVAAPETESMSEENQVPLLTIVRTFVLSFFSSIIPEAPAL